MLCGTFLRVSSHISRAEEESMGIELMKTIEYRTTYHLPNTSDIVPSHSTQLTSRRRIMDGEPEPVEGRKRTFSVIPRLRLQLLAYHRTQKHSVHNILVCRLRREICNPKPMAPLRKRYISNWWGLVPRDLPYGSFLDFFCWLRNGSMSFRLSVS